MLCLCLNDDINLRATYMHIYIYIYVCSLDAYLVYTKMVYTALTGCCPLPLSYNISSSTFHLLILLLFLQQHLLSSFLPSISLFPLLFGLSLKCVWGSGARLAAICCGKGWWHIYRLGMVVIFSDILGLTTVLWWEC
uniref:Uncharacterized protein n=1 Tax=Arundo donax TaxID=35708 RepID=A0A0A9CJB5_ARUDO